MAQATAAPPAMSSFMRSMSARGLDGDSASVERDALPDETEHRSGRRPGRLVADGDEPWRLRAPAADAEQHAHAEPLELLVLEDVDS